MANVLVECIWKALTGTPWTTTRTASIEFGPPPAARYRAELARYTDAQLMAHGPQILAALMARDARRARSRVSAR